jgi:hypothetical protein
MRKTDIVMNGLRLCTIPTLLFWVMWGFAACLFAGAPGLLIGLPVLILFSVLMLLPESAHVRHPRRAVVFSAVIMILAVVVLATPMRGGESYWWNILAAVGLVAKPALIWIEKRRLPTTASTATNEPAAGGSI